jgi:3-dehydroquinate dehydratase / shikimate dehydrogenase
LFDAGFAVLVGKLCHSVNRRIYKSLRFPLLSYEIVNTARNKGKICVSVAAPTVDEMIEGIRRAESCADVVEVRVDYLSSDDATRLIGQLPAIGVPYLFTFRPADAGGHRKITLGENLKFWERLFNTVHGEFLIDIHSDPKMTLAVEPDNVQRIVSMHDLTGTAAVHHAFDHIATLNNAIPKVAAAVNDTHDAIPVWRLIERAKQAGKCVIPVAMGETGKWTRILGLAHGAYLTYASLAEGKETAEGQLTADDMVNVYRVKELDRETRVYGVIGDPVSGSLSPYIHNAAFAAARLNAVFVPFLVKDLDAFFKRMVLPATREVELNFAGFAVTMPHKLAVMKYLDRIDETAERIGAVNAIMIENDGTLAGYNTDAHGFIAPLKANVGTLKGANVAVLGAGGAARACVDALKREDAVVTVFARDQKKAAVFASEFEVATDTISNLRSEISNFEVLVNATPFGMKGELENTTPLTAEQLKGVNLVFDLVTSSSDTPLVREAKAAGVPTISGIEMLLEQALTQFETWTGVDAPRDAMHAACLERMEKLK